MEVVDFLELSIIEKHGLNEQIQYLEDTLCVQRSTSDSSNRRKITTLGTVVNIIL